MSTLYAYVSRGVIAREAVTGPEGQRVSRFRRDDVLALARARTRPRAGAVPLIESEVTQLDASGRLAFRGVDVADCAVWGFERTACHVLGLSHATWSTARDAPVPGDATGADIVRRTVMRSAARDVRRASLDSGHCRDVAVTAVAASTAALTGLHDGTVAERLARAWMPESADDTWRDGVTRALDVALTVLVDHELTASTLAARTAAGVGADPWMVLLTGLAAMSGRAQAGASRAATAALRAWIATRTVPDAAVPGFGHKVYVGPDPRAALLLERVATVSPETADVVDAFAVQVAREHSLYLNIDAALAALVLAADLPADAGEVVFTLARIPGLMAHALEEYPHGLRLRPRALA
ncbi:citrate/2-methylcitrate synthase [Streptomyces sp. BSE7-9]|uniref:citrate/2-methylcitrate synthase n=1 Tax=Streptomyces sp. BSE7-9 TaxID=2759948 RepID=UPI0027DB074D|nr:citrate/2-methylcitrate synthase [Streptomyces sp. BSE7-9]